MKQTRSRGITPRLRLFLTGGDEPGASDFVLSCTLLETAVGWSSGCVCVDCSKGCLGFMDLYGFEQTQRVDQKFMQLVSRKN